MIIVHFLISKLKNVRPFKSYIEIKLLFNLPICNFTSVGPSDLLKCAGNGLLSFNVNKRKNFFNFAPQVSIRHDFRYLWTVLLDMVVCIKNGIRYLFC